MAAKKPPPPQERPEAKLLWLHAAFIAVSAIDPELRATAAWKSEFVGHDARVLFARARLGAAAFAPMARGDSYTTEMPEPRGWSGWDDALQLLGAEIDRSRPRKLAAGYHMIDVYHLDVATDPAHPLFQTRALPDAARRARQQAIAATIGVCGVEDALHVTQLKEGGALRTYVTAGRSRREGVLLLNLSRVRDWWGRFLCAKPAELARFPAPELLLLVPCKVKTGAIADILEAGAVTNAARVPTSPLEQVEDALAMHAPRVVVDPSGAERVIPGKTQEQIAKALTISRASAGNLLQLAKLHADLRLALLARRLRLATAYELARQGPQRQLMLWGKIKDASDQLGALRALLGEVQPAAPTAVPKAVRSSLSRVRSRLDAVLALGGATDPSFAVARDVLAVLCGDTVAERLPAALRAALEGAAPVAASTAEEPTTAAKVPCSDPVHQLVESVNGSKPRKAKPSRKWGASWEPEEQAAWERAGVLGPKDAEELSKGGVTPKQAARPCESAGLHGVLGNFYSRRLLTLVEVQQRLLQLPLPSVDDDRTLALSVVCSTCGADEGQPCAAGAEPDYHLIRAQIGRRAVDLRAALTSPEAGHGG